MDIGKRYKIVVIVHLCKKDFRQDRQDINPVNQHVNSEVGRKERCH
jgi:hypothetical protein